MWYGFGAFDPSNELVLRTRDTGGFFGWMPAFEFTRMFCGEGER